MAGYINPEVFENEYKCNELEMRDGIYFVSVANKALVEGIPFVDFVNFYYNTPDPGAIGADNLITALKVLQAKSARKRRI